MLTFVIIFALMFVLFMLTQFLSFIKELGKFIIIVFKYIFFRHNLKMNNKQDFINNEEKINKDILIAKNTFINDKINKLKYIYPNCNKELLNEYKNNYYNYTMQQIKDLEYKIKISNYK